MNIPYRTRVLLKRIGMVLLFLVLVLIIAWFCTVVWLERYIVYTRDGAMVDMSYSSNEMQGELAVPPVSGGDTGITIYFNEGDNAIETSNEMFQLNGYFISMDLLRTDIAGVWDLLAPLPAGTPIMIDVKGGMGAFCYTSSLQDAPRATTVSVDAVDELIKNMQAKGFYTIARVSAFRDYNFGLNHVPNGLMHVNRKGLWPDSDNCYWLKPNDPVVQNWIISIVNELKGIGFDEVVLTDFWFPNSDKYIFNEDKDQVLAETAANLLKNCTAVDFVLSFSTNNPAFPLPEGRTRLYLENVGATQVGANVAQCTVENQQINLAFMAQSNDSRFNDYSVLRPITSAEVLEAQKAEQVEQE